MERHTQISGPGLDILLITATWDDSEESETKDVKGVWRKVVEIIVIKN